MMRRLLLLACVQVLSAQLQRTPLHFKLSKPSKSAAATSAADTQEKRKRDMQYSSFSCIGGTQLLEKQGWEMHKHENISMTDNRACVFRNVCLVKGKVVYYMHPEEARAPASTHLLQIHEEFVKLSYITYSPPFSVIVEEKPLPPLPFPDHKTWFASLVSYGFNFAHALVDDLFPILTAVDVFGLELNPKDVGVLFTGCDATFADYHNYYDINRTVSETCYMNYLKYSKLLFGAAAIATPWEAWESIDRCVERFVVGHNHAFGRRHDGRPDNQRSVVFRKGRDAMVRHLQHPDPPHPQQLKVLVIPKINPGYFDDIFWPTMCDDVTAAVLDIAHVEVACLLPGMDTEAEIALIRTATLLISIHGTLSILGLFARDGTVLLTVGPAKRDPSPKELDFLPYVTHIQTLFFAYNEEREDFPAMIRYVLHLSAVNINQTLDEYV